MTVFGWDASHFDGTLTTAILSRARQEGVVFFTHKIGEGLGNTDTTQGTALAAARAAAIPVLGGYYIPHQGVDPAAQARRCIALADQYEPWWRTFPGWFWQADLERWSPTDRPTPAECKTFCDTLASLTGRVVVAYASRGQYGNDLAGLGHPLWNAAYGTNPGGVLEQAYPGDRSSGWTPYSGQTPVMLQYSSNVTIAGLSTCDADAFRGSMEDLLTLIGGHTMATLDTTDASYQDLIYNARAILDQEPVSGGPSKVPNKLSTTLAGIVAELDAVKAAVAALAAPTVDVDALAAAIVAKLPAQTVTDDSVKADVTEVLDEVHLTVTPPAAP